jgi:protein SCO1/2
MTKNNTLRTIAFVITLIAIGSGIGIYTARHQNPQSAPKIQGMLWPASKNLIPFSTLDQNGKEFGLPNLQGKWSFLFFGYTHCPDICPITLAILNQIYKKLQAGQQHADAQMIFVSVDPERDTPEQLRDYLAYFNENFIGLGGTLEQIQSLTTQIGIAFFHEQASATGDYLVGHSASIILIGPKGQLIAIFSAPHQAEDILSRFLEIKTFLNKQN